MFPTCLNHQKVPTCFSSKQKKNIQNHTIRVHTKTKTNYLNRTANILNIQCTALLIDIYFSYILHSAFYHARSKKLPFQLTGYSLVWCSPWGGEGRSSKWHWWYCPKGVCKHWQSLGHPGKDPAGGTNPSDSQDWISHKRILCSLSYLLTYFSVSVST